MVMMCLFKTAIFELLPASLLSYFTELTAIFPASFQGPVWLQSPGHRNSLIASDAVKCSSGAASVSCHIHPGWAGSSEWIMHLPLLGGCSVHRAFLLFGWWPQPRMPSSPLSWNFSLLLPAAFPTPLFPSTCSLLGIPHHLLSLTWNSTSPHKIYIRGRFTAWSMWYRGS